jgi:hypothetical protein
LHRAVVGCRIALAAHGRRRALGRLSPGWSGRTGADEVSVLLVTMRPSFLDHAIAGLAAQRDVDQEVVLVTHGFDLGPDELSRLREIAPNRLVVSSQPATTLFGDVMNHATSLASGRYVAKIDDDDWYGEHHLRDLLNAHEWSGATLTGAPWQYTYLADLDITVRRRTPVIGRPVLHVAGPTMLLARDDLRHLGGWRRVPRAVDLSLSHAVREAGGLLYQYHGLGFMLCRHGTGHTWDPGTGSFLHSAVEQWRGLHVPPEIHDQSVATRHYEQVQRMFAPDSQDAQRPVASGSR